MHLPLTPPTGRPPEGDARADLASLVLARRRDAVQRLTAAAGSSSLCTLSRSGTPRPAVKYLEGTVAALSDVRRALRDRPGDAEPATTDAAARASIDEARERWLARRGRSAASSSDWQAYLDGAVDALDELVATAERYPDAAGGADSPAPGIVTPLTRSAPPREHGTRTWRPGRRAAATTVLAPPLFAALVATGGGWTPLSAPLWTALVALTSVVGAATLSTYLPLRGQGRRPNAGCTPCAAMSAVTVLGAAWLLGSAPLQPTMAAVALAAVTFGLVQRVTGAGTACAT
ncbi:hypothetical protein ATJ97_1484 [Georgenia soli]|uniref:Uncharacterized protein n=1 Tax=Georgenia soli TaxID=638953 RepID=A0A2A9EL71_9MICO|nr:hypothetical protein [Georgenia soli]PFG38990.1 hypothetical protein ATJ97_1484 [Georgenia soli]